MKNPLRFFRSKVTGFSEFCQCKSGRICIKSGDEYALNLVTLYLQVRPLRRYGEVVLGERRHRQRLVRPLKEKKHFEQILPKRQLTLIEFEQELVTLPRRRVCRFGGVRVRIGLGQQHGQKVGLFRPDQVFRDGRQFALFEFALLFSRHEGFGNGFGQEPFDGLEHQVGDYYFCDQIWSSFCDQFLKHLVTTPSFILPGSYEWGIRATAAFPSRILCCMDPFCFAEIFHCFVGRPLLSYLGARVCSFCTNSNIYFWWNLYKNWSDLGGFFGLRPNFGRFSGPNRNLGAEWPDLVIFVIRSSKFCTESGHSIYVPGRLLCSRLETSR